MRQPSRTAIFNASQHKTHALNYKAKYPVGLSFLKRQVLSGRFSFLINLGLQKDRYGFFSISEYDSVTWKPAIFRLVSIKCEGPTHQFMNFVKMNWHDNFPILWVRLITSRLQGRNKLTVNVITKLLNETKRSKRSILIGLQNKKNTEWTGYKTTFWFSIRVHPFEMLSVLLSSKPIDRVTLLVCRLNQWIVSN